MISELATVLSTDILQAPLGVKSHDAHQFSAINWLKRAHDSSKDGGVGYGYYLRGRPFHSNSFGWRASYVETSGYIVETFYDIAKAYDDPDSARRAANIGRWLLSQQNDDGSFSNPNLSLHQGIVFDTGQVLFGLVRCFQETGDEAFAIAARDAAQWLVTSQDSDGAWRRNTHNGVVHTYNSRVAWALLRYEALFSDKHIRQSAIMNLDWSLRQQNNQGLFNNCGFDQRNTPPFTHTIAYAIRGLYESGKLLECDRYLNSAYEAANVMSDFVDRQSGFMPGRISASNERADNYCCLTGNAQMAIIWYKLGIDFQDTSLTQTAHKALDYVLNVHDIESENDNLRGGVKGSHPIWGKYTPFAYPNWATKFLIDALLVKERCAGT